MNRTYARRHPTMVTFVIKHQASASVTPPPPVAGLGIGGSVELIYCGSKPRALGQWAAANCAAPPTASAAQYTQLYSPTVVAKMRQIMYTNRLLTHFLSILRHFEL